MKGETMTEGKGRMGFREACRALMTPEAKRRSRIFNIWAFVWVFSWVGATILINDRIVAAPLTWVVALIPSVLGVQAIRSYMVFLRAADELLRKIHLEGLALGFGAGVIFMIGYRLLERAGAPGLDISDPIIVMVLVWSSGVWLALRRYL